MTAREQVERHARCVPGGIAWECSIFRLGASSGAVELIDAAVDLAWERLKPEHALEHPPLEICERGTQLVIRAVRTRLDVMLRTAA